MKGVAVTALAVAALVGCGSSGAKHTAKPERSGDQAEGRASSPRLPAADSNAYFQIASASGVLRLATARVALGRGGTIDRAQIAGGSRRLARVHPTDPQLRRLRAQLAAACSAALRGAGGPGQTARRALTATTAVNAGLRRFARRHRSVAGLIPD